MLRLLLLCIVLVNADCGPWIPIDITLIPKNLPTDQIDVNYLAAPLEECQYNDDAWWINAFHGALSFRNRRNGFVITANFEAWPSFQEALLPNIVKYPNGTIDLQWENSGRIFVYKGENDTYWDEVMIPIATMNGTVYNKFINWMSKANSTVPYYNLWSVWTNWPGKQLMPNYECFAFVWTMFDQLKTFGATFDPKVKPKQSFITLYSDNQPKLANTSDPLVMNDLVKFYEGIEAKIAQVGIIGFLTELWSIVVDGTFYVRKDNDYYFVKLNHFPYVGIHYTEIPLPWQ